MLLYGFALTLATVAVFTLVSFRYAVRFGIERMQTDRKTNFDGYWKAKNQAILWDKAYRRGMASLSVLSVAGLLLLFV